VISLEGVGSRLWAGTRKGLIYAYDVTGSSKNEAIDPTTEDRSRDLEPVDSASALWVITHIWKALGEPPVARIVVDPFSVAEVGLTSSLMVYFVL
jgi:hypothetical protein